MDLLINVIGMAGAAGLLLTYFLLSSGKLDNRLPPYHIMNFFSSLFLDIQAIHAGIIPFIVINTSWCIISIYALIRIHTNKRNAA